MEEKKRIWDKILIGIVIGGAIGSVVGASLAPKKGKETREDIIKAATKAKFSVKSVFQKAKKILSRKHDKKNDL
ncbi:MAG: YtxH domain-containing protein [Patescibacteria group bacterium]